MEKGTYIIVTEAKHAFSCQVGKLGKLTGQAGFYFYVGSALGSGGIKARVNHHLKISHRPRWHFDYLRPFVVPRRIWFCCSPNHYEHHWAAVLAALPGAELPLIKFGATDCQCATHLYYFNNIPRIHAFRNALHIPGKADTEPREVSADKWKDNQVLFEEC